MQKSINGKLRQKRSLLRSIPSVKICRDMFFLGECLQKTEENSRLSMTFM